MAVAEKNEQTWNVIIWEGALFNLAKMMASVLLKEQQVEKLKYKTLEVM